VTEPLEGAMTHPADSPLAGVYAKLCRGAKHLEELKRQERAFLATNAAEAFEEVDLDREWRIERPSFAGLRKAANTVAILSVADNRPRSGLS